MSRFDRDIADIVAGVWDSVFGTSVVEEDVVRVAARRGRIWSAVLTITGAWDGAVALQAGEDLVRRAAAAMFGGDPEAISSGQMHDALGEMTSRVGGNFQVLLPAPSRLAAPVIVEADDFGLRLPNTAQVLQSAFRSGQDVCCVRVFQRLPERGAS